MKRIEYIMPVDWLRGNISGRQTILYNGGAGYDVTTGTRVTAAGYQPRLIAKVFRLGQPNMLRFYQVRTRTTVNMTARYRLNLAAMGGACAIFAALCSDKESSLYIAAANEWKNSVSDKTFRAWVIGKLRAGLAAKDETIVLNGSVSIDNPWVYSGQEPNVPVSQSILTKFADQLSV